jgi:D-alanyl-D-alanine carboxypeptidase/D-alanyl-D-alanine-endopeptidase (penicillin-binding protein 4)
LQDVRVINKVSQNLHAEILLRLLGRERGNAGTIEGGLEVLRGFLTQAGNLERPICFLRRLRTLAPEPGNSSRHCAVTALLLDAALGRRLQGDLPDLGRGWLALRTLNSARLQKRILAKTGSLGGVKALSGYATTDSGKRRVFHPLQ